MRYPISQMYYTKSTYIIVQNILFERLLNAVRVAVIDQWNGVIWNWTITNTCTV